MAQTQLQLAQSNPQIHNLYQAYRSMYEAIGVKNINAILPAPAQPTPMDPAMEHIQALAETISSFSWSRSQSTHRCTFKFSCKLIW